MSLKDLNDEALLENTKSLVAKEREILVEVLRHLEEIETRKLYLERGFPSLFELCVRELGYSESAAGRRINAMRLTRVIPEVCEKVQAL